MRADMPQQHWGRPPVVIAIKTLLTCGSKVAARQDGCINLSPVVPGLFCQLGKASVVVPCIPDLMLNTLQYNLVLIALHSKVPSQTAVNRQDTPSVFSPHPLGSLATRLGSLAGSQLPLPP